MGRATKTVVGVLSHGEVAASLRLKASVTHTFHFTKQTSKMSFSRGNPNSRKRYRDDDDYGSGYRGYAPHNRGEDDRGRPKRVQMQSFERLLEEQRTRIRTARARQSAAQVAIEDARTFLRNRGWSDAAIDCHLVKTTSAEPIPPKSGSKESSTLDGQGKGKGGSSSSLPPTVPAEVTQASTDAWKTKYAALMETDRNTVWSEEETSQEACVFFWVTGSCPLSSEQCSGSHERPDTLRTSPHFLAAARAGTLPDHAKKFWEEMQQEQQKADSGGIGDGNISNLVLLPKSSFSRENAETSASEKPKSEQSEEAMELVSRDT
ncbi:hypothetical protein LTR37_001675 [Vermiconidia calcicola]|uniref:Uncharacterized protein n=1 Tax=Vermiconidia calcicola TaxID=1690605 RepID=A0ACC3NUS2_9PEZI|nr:hypothetical protein LTR37_001675 [Vermiconidia calcicola]